MPIRYMGTKRSVAVHVREQIADLSPRRLVLDLFSGIGCVSECLVDVSSIYTNDALSFTAVIARARFKGERDKSAQQLIDGIKGSYRESVEGEAMQLRTLLRQEQRAMDLGCEALAQYISEAQHVANSSKISRSAVLAAKATDIQHYRMIRHYFAAGYFSTRQAIQLDALRYAIDKTSLSEADRDWALSAWLSAAAILINAPGHTAQYLRPNTEEAYKRIRRVWARPVWETFQNQLLTIKPVGDPKWRRANRVEVDDALHLLNKERLRGVAVVYADPPYTKDQYSRYYHLYETMYRYDYPESIGVGRVRPDRFVSSFCLKTQVADSFQKLFAAVAAQGLPLVLSYPSEGLLSRTETSIAEIGSNYMSLKTVRSFGAQHSTMGASKGTMTKSATENIYVYTPTR